MHDEGDVVGAQTFSRQTLANLEALSSTLHMDGMTISGRMTKSSSSAAAQDLASTCARGQSGADRHIAKTAWVDIRADAMNPPFEPNSIDTIICSHMIHYMAQPTLLSQSTTTFRDRGRIIIQDLNAALTMRSCLGDAPRRLVL
ncbi:MAG: methyltransferase domain-containing protein [Sphingomonadales bacterium]|nr:methyltransferase domain-containing protein [Sphingomonadales bacterium]